MWDYFKYETCYQSTHKMLGVQQLLLLPFRMYEWMLPEYVQADI